MSQVIATHAHVRTVLDHFKRAALRRSECVVLLIARRGLDGIQVTEVYRPDQSAGRDYFWLEPRSMARIFAKIRDERLMIAAQIHTHPREAFHSDADDTWAIIRHEGALSLVVPYFGKRTSPETFLDDMVLFRYDEAGQWMEVTQQAVSTHFIVKNE